MFLWNIHHAAQHGQLDVRGVCVPRAAHSAQWQAVSAHETVERALLSLPHSHNCLLLPRVHHLQCTLLVGTQAILLTPR